MIAVDGTFSMNGVEFKADLDPVMGLKNTLMTVNKLPQKQLNRLADGYGLTIGRGTSSFDALLAIAGEVQNEWYLAVKGEIPMSVQKNQEDRKKKAAATKTEKAPAEKKERVLKVMKVATGKTEEIKELKGQAALVVKHLKALGKANVNEVGEALKADPEFKTKQDPARVAGFYFTQLGKDGLLVEASS